MKGEMSHAAAAAELEAVTLGATSSDAARAARAHAATCEQCARDLAELEIMVAEIAALLPEKTLNRGRSAGIRSRLLARARADADITARRRTTTQASRAANAGTPVLPARAPDEQAPEQLPVPILAPMGLPASARSSSTITRRWAVAATIAFLASTAMLGRLWAERGLPQEPGGTQGEDLAARVDSLSQALAEKERALSVVSSPGVRIVSLTNSRSLNRSRARMFWDPRAGRWTLIVYDLRQPRPGRAYQVWLVTTDNQRVSAGMFRTGEDGTAMMEMTHPMGPGSLRAIAVTEEPANGVDSPTGQVVLAGAASL